MTKPAPNTNAKPITSNVPHTLPTDPITYAFKGRRYIVQPIFKSEGAATLRDVLLRLMRADLETS